MSSAVFAVLAVAPQCISPATSSLPRFSSKQPMSIITLIDGAKNRTSFIHILSNPRFNPRRQKQLQTAFCSSPPPTLSCRPGYEPNGTGSLVSSRLERLVAEFQSLVKPIDRVKRLLDYATVLPRLGRSTRSSENRIAGCAAQVWLEVEVDEAGRMRFGADSDSEITKGFCSCLIYLLDGASPEEVLKVKAEDLTDMNVGLPVRSRVNSWNNVLIGMQERTKSLMAKREELVPLDHLPSLAISPESAKGEVLFP